MGRISFAVRFFSLGIILAISLQEAGAQFYNTGQDPGSLKWEQIRSDHFRVIFPEDFRKEANRATWLLESYYEENSRGLDHRPKPIPVIIHNHSVLSNGYVAWAPRRMELVPVPNADNFSQEYMEQLLLHEFRHVVQVDKLRQGFTKGLSYLAGEAGQGAVTGLLPFWYLEGDATDAETRLSFAGRGRLPGFEMGIKAILAEKPGLYSYEKAIFGSFKDYIPNHYEYGYQMVAHGRNKYGDQLWTNMVDNVARRPFTLYPNYFSLKKQTGLSKTEFYRETFETLRTHWQEQASLRTHTEGIKVNRKEKKHFTSYMFPSWLNDSVLFVRKSGIAQIDEFITIDRSGKEKRLHRPGYYYPASISVAAGKIVWAEYIWDPRWQRRTYSVIKIYDINSRQERILRLRTRYFAPDLSSDGNFIVTVEADELNRYSLVILHSNTGEIISSFESPDNHYLQYPVWNRDKSKIYMTSLSSSGKKIISLDIRTGEWSTHFDAGFTDIAQLECQGDYLVFRAGFSGIDNIHAMNLESNEIQKVTSSRLGAHHPALSANADTLVYADYTSQGFDLVKLAFNPSKFTPLDQENDHNEQLNIPSEEDESRVIQPGEAPVEYPVEKYRKAGNLFRFHSWAPLYADLDNPSIEELPVSPGLMLVSQNNLSTATTVFGYEYKLDEKDHYLHASFTYSGWYPVLKFSMDYGGTPTVGPPPDSTVGIPTISTDLSFRTKADIPLYLTFNRYSMGARPSVEASYSRAYFYYEDPGAYRRGLTFMDYRLYYYAFLKKGTRDILPRFGGSLDLRFIDTPFEEEQLGTQSLLSGVLYLPGPLRHQTLRIFGGKHKQEPKNYLMGNIMSLPRGYHPYTATELAKVTFDYVFPIAYPDWQIWRAAYFKRFRGSVFYDYAVGKGVYTRTGVVDRNFQSVGLELTTDVHLAQIFVPFNIGGRFIYIPESGSTSGEFVFSVDLSQF